MKRRTEIELTNMCLIYKENHLLVEEKIGDGYKGIVFPGGHVEEGESFRDSVIREMKEETGLTIENPVLCGIKDWIEEDGTRYMVLLYKTDQFHGNLKDSEEGKVFWVTRKEFAEMDVLWNMKELLQIYDGEGFSEFFFRIVDGKYKGQLLK